jgi:hypothetical protein
VLITNQQNQSQVSCLVTKLSDGFDSILGDNWLNKHRAHIDYNSKAYILYNGSKIITISSENTSKKKFKPQDKILSILQYKRTMKKGRQPLLVHLNKKEKEKWITIRKFFN